ncbi:transporter substrate-binding domain-containing protein [Phyllobacterium sp. YR531]|uniref:transporter substrate-binding domain-containing protein n=1 Tax=Phyllobacterium sp. YR531 TaxID=1144343 RepID=UPI00026FBA51|nr:transporter substrate-binding domain-containing protein [Phyllobacterium sp. YR531]EJN06746.1 periplasmic component of amino acid ABC-type transporter/signal transduction system [Phyllobacterium sp. YR531]
MQKIYSNVIATSFALALGATTAATAATVDDLKARGRLLCSAHTSSYFGFAELTDTGTWKGFDIDFCKAVATAVLEDPEKVNYVPVDWNQRFPALQSGELDVVFKNTTWTLSRDAELGFQFTIPYLFNGVQIAVPAKSGINSPKELAGATACGLQGSSTELVLADYFATLGQKYNSITYGSTDEVTASYLAGRCDYMAAVGLTLAISLKGHEAENKILPDLLNLNVNAGAVRQGDDHWLDIVNWTIAALIEADSLGITSKNIDEMVQKGSKDVAIGRFLGVTPGVGAKLKLRDTWARDVIKAVGNYGEIYDRNIGAESPYKLERGKNQPASKGGLLVAPVFD